MRIVFLSFGTLLLLLFLIFMGKGKKYASYTDNLDSNTFPMSDLYVVGFSMMLKKPFGLRGKIRSNLVGNAKLLYDGKYAEYFATVTWAQTLTMVHMFLCFGFLLAGALDFAFFALIGIFFAVFCAVFFATQMKNKIEERRNLCTEELPEVVSSMALLINSGMILKEAWKKIAFSKEGEIYTLMKGAIQDMENGLSEVDAIHKFGLLTDSVEVKKFSSSLIQGLEKGSKDLAEFLIAQSSEMWELKKNIMLQKGEAASSKLLMPIALIFLGVIVLVIGGAVGMLL